MTIVHLPPPLPGCLARRGRGPGFHRSLGVLHARYFAEARFELLATLPPLPGPRVPASLDDTLARLPSHHTMAQGMMLFLLRIITNPMFMRGRTSALDRLTAAVHQLPPDATKAVDNFKQLRRAFIALLDEAALECEPASSDAEEQGVARFQHHLRQLLERGLDINASLEELVAGHFDFPLSTLLQAAKLRHIQILLRRGCMATGHMDVALPVEGDSRQRTAPLLIPALGSKSWSALRTGATCQWHRCWPPANMGSPGSCPCSSIAGRPWTPSTQWRA
jgi:hypothetical protein